MIDTLIYDPTFWVAVSFIAFILLIRKPVGSKIAASLDARSAKIKNELDEAVRLREEAQAVLLAYQKKQRECLKEAEDILSNTQEDAKRMAEQAETDLKASLEKRKNLAMEKIAQAEKQALQDVQNNMVDIAVAAAHTIIAKQFSSGDGSTDLIELSTEELARKLH